MNDVYDILLKAYTHACNILRTEISRLELNQALPSNNPDAEDNPLYVQGRIDSYKDVLAGMEGAIVEVQRRRAK